MQAGLQDRRRSISNGDRPGSKQITRGQKGFRLVYILLMMVLGDLSVGDIVGPAVASRLALISPFNLMVIGD